MLFIRAGVFRMNVPCLDRAKGLERVTEEEGAEPPPANTPVPVQVRVQKIGPPPTTTSEEPPRIQMLDVADQREPRPDRFSQLPTALPRICVRGGCKLQNSAMCSGRNSLSLASCAQVF